MKARQIFDRILLEMMRSIYTSFPETSRAPLERLGLLKDRSRWKNLGMLPLRQEKTGYLLFLDMQYWYQRMAYLFGTSCETHINAFLDRYLHLNDVFIDIGANIGIHTLHSSFLVGSKGACYAVEPNPNSYKILQAHIHINRLDNVKLFNLALGDSQGFLPLQTYGGEHELSNAREQSGSEEFTVQVPVDLGDSLFSEIDETVAGICKIDVEGYEIKVLQGLKNFVESHPRFMFCVEVLEELLTATGGSTKELFLFFAEYDFVPFQFGRDHNLQSVLYDTKLMFCDVVFIHKDHVH